MEQKVTDIINQGCTIIVDGSTEVKKEMDMVENPLLQPNLILKIKEKFQKVFSEVSKSQNSEGYEDLIVKNDHKVKSEQCMSPINLNLTETKYDLPKDELLNKLITNECDLPTLKSDVDFLEESCSSKQSQDKRQSRHDGSKMEVRYSSTVSKKNYLYPHKRLKHLDGYFRKRWLTCGYCGQCYKDKFEYYIHYLNHFVKINARDLSSSQTNKLSPLKKCNTISKQFEQKSIIKHLTIDNDEKLFECEICLKQFTRKQRLNEHLKIHSGKKPFKCKICTKQFRLKYVLETHVKIHTDEKPFKCEICFMHFKVKQGLNQHLKIHTGQKAFKCEICLKQFTKKQTLQIHLRIHTGEKPFKCKICSKSFARNMSLKMHLKMHTGQKPFKCDVCSKQFKHKKSLNDHLKTHIGGKPFKCKKCLEQFTRNNHLRVHIKMHKCK